MSPKRPPTVRGDDERVAIGRDHRRSPALGVPAMIDPEVTPPPREPPDITSFDGFESIETVVRAPLLAIHRTQRELDVAIARLWEVRNAGEQIGELKSAIAAIAARFDSFGDVTESLRAFGGRLQWLSTWAEEQRRVNQRLDTTLNGLDRRLQEVELEHRTIASTLDAVSARLEASEAAQEKRDAATTAELEKHSERLRAVEDEQLAAKTTVKTAGWFGRGIYTGLAALVAVIAAIASWLRK